ncbi:hypothetical protein GYMLUDRAFT_250144 [Collybiopsis luxurians FD-317 M1]|uniref:Uncharacterized protein n=1 Tax=Collybiopsis luxurians FD-317 M1 TaxID=944289 RepID=A0A0D0C708_9AGAR|nr:hypothetical protein GYMLUDRAFT_250144 [Collybiopsis luxurians FD-317 M1]
MFVMATSLAPLYRCLLSGLSYEYPLSVVRLKITSLTATRKLSYSPDDTQIHSSLCSAFTSLKSLRLPYRQYFLLQLACMLQEPHTLASAIYADLGKPIFEGYIGKINAMIDRTIISARRVPKWAREKGYVGHEDGAEP